MRRYRGSSAGVPFVTIHTPGEDPRPLPIAAYRSEEQGSLPPDLIAWWSSHDAAVRLAASLLADALGSDLPHQKRAGAALPKGRASLGFAAGRVPMYLAHTYAETVIAHLPDDHFEIAEGEIRRWYDIKVLVDFPTMPDQTTYWREVYDYPLSAWQRGLDEIARRHGLPAGEWRRFPLGRNIVFGCGDAVVKLVPRFWADELPAEAAALRFVAGRLPVPTAELLGEGELDGWGYLAEARLPGALLRDVWPGLGDAERAGLAKQHGALMAAIHALPIAGAPEALRRDWALVVGGQWERCLEGMRSSGVPGPLLADAPAYMAPVRDAVLASEPAVLLHGDLNFLNLLVERGPGGWKIAGLVDWSDVALGPAPHEIISPGVHMYRGDRELLRAWYAGYGLAAGPGALGLQREAMVRAMLWYAAEMREVLSRVPGAAACRSWGEVAERYWHIAD